MRQEENSVEKPGIFDGIRVVDFTHFVSGPTSTMHMADMGAEVIKIERPPAGDPMRTQPGMRNGISALYVWRNRGKKGMCLDMRQPEAAEIFKDLVKVSDVVVENHKPGVMERAGIGYEELKKINPRLIMCSISGYGQYGPISDWPANDVNIQAMSGIVSLSGHPDGPPLPLFVAWVDTGTGMHAFAAVSAALYHRAMTGVGQHIDLAMMEFAFTFHDTPLLEYLWTDGQLERTRDGAMHPTLGGQGVYPCKDGYIVISSTSDGPWRRITALMGRPDLAADPRLANAHLRSANRREVNEIISEFTKSFTMEDALLVLRENDIVATPILSIGEVVNHPQIKAREMVVEVDDPRAGRVKLPNTSFHFSETTAAVRATAPMLGQHNEEVLTGLLGYSQERVAQLWEKRVLYAEEAVSEL